jgi:CheY-like chemotaxis protein
MLRVREDAMAEGTRHRLLIVDDEAEIRTTLAQYFGGLGYAVDIAADAPEALAKLEQGFDAILSDIRMPGMDGIDFLQQARRLNPEAGIFLITGFASLDTMIEAKQWGAIGYFRKPLRLTEVDSQLRAFLGEDARSLLEGVLLVVGPGLLEQLGPRLARFQSRSCEAEEAAFLKAVDELHPKVVLADAADPATPALLQAYRKLGREANSFLLVSDDGSLEAASELLFGRGAAGCIPWDAPQEVFEQAIKEAVERRAAEKLDQQGRVEALANRCTFAKAYRNGYYCLSQGGCPYGPYRGGWIAIEGKEFQKCLKRPLLVESLEAVGFVSWTGRLEAARAPELRRQLLALIREGKRELIVDAHGLEAVHPALFEILAEASAELVKLHPEGLLHVINLAEELEGELRAALVGSGVRCYGVRMVDERRVFERWGSRFD